VIVVADTSGIIAASDRNAAEAAACRDVLQEAGTVVISPLVLAEVDHLAKARFGASARTTIIDFVIAQARQLRFQIPETSIEVLDAARMVQKQYASLDLDPGQSSNDYSQACLYAYAAAGDLNTSVTEALLPPRGVWAPLGPAVQATYTNLIDVLNQAGC